ncbi:MAG: outer membrane lipoprotein carrier protein LolA, partial [Thermodesulfovibrionales bacterium]
MKKAFNLLTRFVMPACPASFFKSLQERFPTSGNDNFRYFIAVAMNTAIGRVRPTLPTAGHRFFGTVIASVLFMFIAGMAVTPVSGSSETDDSVEKIQKAYENIRDMKGSFTQKNTIKDLNKTDTYKGEFFIKQPLKMKWLYTGKAAQDIYISNDTVMIFKKGDKQAYKGKFDKKTYGQTPIALLGGFGNIGQEFNISVKGKSL